MTGLLLFVVLSLGCGLGSAAPLVAIPPHAPSEEKRLVTLAPVIAEWTAEILGKVQVLRELIGVSEYSQYPSFLNAIETVGPYPQLQLEKILTLKPSLVIGSSEYTRPAQAEQMKRLHLNLVLLPKESFRTMPDWIQKLGNALQVKDGVAPAITRWKEGVAALPHFKTERKIMIQVQAQPLVVVGGNSFLNEAFTQMGAKNIFGELNQGYPKVSKEAVLSAHPDQILIFDLAHDPKEMENAKRAWPGIPVELISADDFGRCSLQLLKALKQLH